MDFLNWNKVFTVWTNNPLNLLVQLPIRIPFFFSADMDASMVCSRISEGQAHYPQSYPQVINSLIFFTLGNFEYSISTILFRLRQYPPTFFLSHLHRDP